MKQKKNIRIHLLFGFIILIISILNQVIAGVDRPIIVGSEKDYPPFALGQTAENASGFSVELWKAVAQEVKIPYILEVKAFHQLLDEFKAGKVDVMINLAQTEQRHQFADFTVPTAIVQGAIFVRNDSENIHSETELAGKSIIVIKSDQAQDYAIAKGWAAQLVLVDTAEEGFRLLSRGESDALLIGKLTGLQSLAKSNITIIKALNITLGFSQKFAFAVQEGQVELLAQINEGLALTKANGTYDALYEKWFGVYEERHVIGQLLFPFIVPLLALSALVCYLLNRRALEIKAAKKAQQELYSRLQKISSLVPGLLYQYHLHKDGSACFPYASEAIRSIYRVSPEDVREDASKVMTILHPEDYQGVIDSIARSALHLTPWNYQYRVKFKDGTVRWLLGNANPQQEPDGSVLWHGYIADMTEQKHAETLIKQNQDRLNDAMQGANDGYWDWNLETNEVFYSPRWFSMLGYTENELPSNLETWSMLVNPLERENALKAVSDYLAGKSSSYVVEFQMRHKEGQWIDILSRAKLAVDSQGVTSIPRRLVGTHVDISERKASALELLSHRDHLQKMVDFRTSELVKAKETAEQANALKSELLSNISHELRTPMHAILAFSDLGLKAAANGPRDKLQSYFQRIQASSGRLTLLLNDLLDTSKFEANQMNLLFEQHDLYQLTQGVLIEFGSLSLAKQLKVTIEKENSVTLACIDIFRFGQVIRNLLSNAIKFTPPYGNIKIRLSPAELPKGKRASDIGNVAAIQLDISDSGLGIPENELESIFEKFVQSSKTKTNAGGTGLGLTLSKNIINAHRGKIFARNNADIGCTMSVIVPVERIIPIDTARVQRDNAGN